MGQSSRGSSPSVVHAPQPVATAVSPHFLGAPPLLAPPPSNGYYGNHQNVTLPVNDYQNDHDDDVQILEDYMDGFAQEESVFIDDDGDEERDEEAILDSGNSDLQRSRLDSSNAYEDRGRSHGDQGRSTGNQGHRGNTSHRYGEVDLQTLTQFVDGESHDRDLSSSGSGRKVETGQASDGDGTASAQGNTTTAACLHGNASRKQNDLEEAGVGSRRLRVKREKLSSAPSPPPPPLPSRQDSSPDDPREESCVSPSGEASIMHTLAGGQQNENHTGFDDCGHYGQGEMPHPTTVAVPRSAEEPALKKIKLENTLDMHADADDSSQTSDGSTSLTNDACAARMHNADTSQINSANTSQINIPNADHLTSRMVANSETSHTTKASSIRTARGTANTARQIANHVTDMTSQMTNPMTCVVTSQMTNHVTNVVTSQMTNLMQTLVTSLVEKSSPGVATDAEVAFANHMVCELRKLDEDLRADVKFSIQKTIYEAQKEMRQRRAQQEDSARYDAQPEINIHCSSPPP